MKQFLINGIQIEANDKFEAIKQFKANDSDKLSKLAYELGQLANYFDRANSANSRNLLSKDDSTMLKKFYAKGLEVLNQLKKEVAGMEHQNGGPAQRTSYFDRTDTVNLILDAADRMYYLYKNIDNENEYQRFKKLGEQLENLAKQYNSLAKAKDSVKDSTIVDSKYGYFAMASEVNNDILAKAKSYNLEYETIRGNYFFKGDVKDLFNFTNEVLGVKGTETAFINAADKPMTRVKKLDSINDAEARTKNIPLDNEGVQTALKAIKQKYSKYTVELHKDIRYNCPEISVHSNDFKTMDYPEREDLWYEIKKFINSVTRSNKFTIDGALSKEQLDFEFRSGIIQTNDSINDSINVEDGPNDRTLAKIIEMTRALTKMRADVQNLNIAFYEGEHLVDDTIMSLDKARKALSDLYDMTKSL